MGTIESLAENRKHARISLFISFSLRLDSEQYTGLTGNVSLGGVYLQTISPSLQQSQLAKSAEITLNLDSITVTTDCRIVYIGGGAIPHPQGVGVAFENISGETITTLREFILTKL
jgi:c-di-GMP-binding flagellar brake protein YcgR